MNAADRYEPTVRPLAIAECWELLTTVPIGRLAVAIDGEAPLVVPVNHVVEGLTVVFRSSPGTKLDELKRKVVSFQADDIDATHHRGWSVLIRGVAVIEPRTVGIAEPHPWAGLHRCTTQVRIWPEHVSGRYVEPGDLDWEPKGYL